ncbi:MAG: hypothetical protein KC619_11125 [Myxococcales bacterium]|nr:hypothetical protein [Myxococcales bacterium]
MAIEHTNPDPSAPPTLALPMQVLFDALIAVFVGPALAGTLAILLDLPRDSSDGSGVLVAIILVIVLGPSVLGFACVLACVSWAVHSLAHRPRPIAIDAAFGFVGASVVAVGFIAQDVLGIRPESASELLEEPRTLTIVAVGAVVGGLMGFASGAIAHRLAGRFPTKSPSSARFANGMSSVLLFALGLPAIAMLFTFAHFTGRTSGWEIIATPFVFVMALVIVAALGVPLIGILASLVAAHHLLLRHAGTFLLDAAIAMGLTGVCLVVGVSLFDDGMDNFRDLPSFGVAATFSVIYAGVLGATHGLGWGTPPPR